METEHWVELIDQNSYDFNQIAEKFEETFLKRKINVNGKSVMLKVSFVFAVKDPERTKMINTNVQLISAVAFVLCKYGAKKIYIADGETIGSARYAYSMVGIKKAVEQIPKKYRKRIVFAYLDEYKKEWCAPENPIIENIRLDYPLVAKNVDILISMPKLKVNLFANITLSVKNGMGFLTTKTRLKYHNQQLHGLIADIYQIRPPDYVITDAIFAGEGQGPMAADAYPTNLIIFGNNGLAVDATCCYLMGFDPLQIPHLKMLHERGYGPLSVDHVEISPRELMEQRRHEFRRPIVKMDALAPNIHYYAGEVCDSGCPAMIRAMMDSYGQKYNWDWSKVGEMNIIIGKNPPITKEQAKKLPKRRTVVYGNCAKEFKKYGNYYKGCPPNHLMAMASYTFKADWGSIPWLKYVSIWTFMTTTIQHLFAIMFGKKKE